MVCTCPVFSKSSRSFTRALGIAPKAPINISISVTFMLHSLFFLARSSYLSLFYLSFFSPYRPPGWQSLLFHSLYFIYIYIYIYIYIFFFFFFLSIIRFGHLAEIRWFIWISKSQWTLCILSSRTDSGLCKYHLFILWNINCMSNSQWIIFFTQSCLVSYSFYANLLHSLIMW